MQGIQVAKWNPSPRIHHAAGPAWWGRQVWCVGWSQEKSLRPDNAEDRGWLGWSMETAFRLEG